MTDGFRYWAFISYCHRDRRWAVWLHRYLERYRVPRRLVGRDLHQGQIPSRLFPVFRDRDELPSSTDLGGVVQTALRESRYLIVLCSRGSAQSRWVNEEVRSFKRLGREDRIFCLRLDNEPGAKTSFVPALLERYDAQGELCGAAAEPLAADLAVDGQDGAALKLIAGMLGIGYDELRRRERRRRIRNRLLALAAGVLSMIALTMLWRWQQAEKQQALQAQALRSEIHQLYRNGREELLAHHEARAAVYLGEAYRLGMDTPSLRFMLARAMSAVDAQQQRLQTEHPAWLVELSPDLKSAFAIAPDRHLRRYELQHPQRPAFDVDLSPMGSYFAAYSPGGRVIWLDGNHGEQRLLRFFDASTGALLGRYEATTDAGETSPPPIADDDRRLAFVAPDHSVMLGEIGTGLRRIPGPYSAVGFCKRSTQLLLARPDGSVELRDGARASLPLLRRFAGLSQTPLILDSSPACELVAAADTGGAVRVWNGRSGAPYLSSGHRRSVDELRFSADGERLLSMTRAEVGVWNSRSGALVYADRFLDPYRSLAMMRPDGAMLARLMEGSVSLINPDRGELLFSLDGHLGGANSFSFAADGRHAISGGNDGSVVVWNLPAAMHAQFSDEGDNGAPPLVFLPRSPRLFVGGRQAGLYETPQNLIEHPVLELHPSVLAVSADGRLLAMADAQGRVEVHGLPQLQRLRQWPAPKRQRPLALRFDAQAQHLLVAVEDQGSRVLDLQSGQTLRRLANDYSSGAAFSPDRAWLSYAAGDMVYTQTVADGHSVWQQRLPLERPMLLSNVRYSEDGRLLLVTAERRQAFILDAQTGRVLQSLDEPSSVFFAVGSFSHDGQTVAIGDGSKSVLLWYLPQQRHVLLNEHSSLVRAVAFSPDDALLLSAGGDGQIKLWDRGSGDLLYSFTAHEGDIAWNFAGFSPDGRYLYSGGSDGNTRLWPAMRESRKPAQIAERLRCRVAWTVEGASLRAQAIREECPETADAASGP